MKRRFLRPIGIVNHSTHLEASTGGAPEWITSGVDPHKRDKSLPKAFQPTQEKLPKGSRRKQ